MDDLLQEFLTESHEHLDTVDRQIVEFERDPSNNEILRNIFRLVHTIKGTGGFLGLPRLEALTHSAETLLGQLRDGAAVTPQAVSLTLATIDRVKMILAALEQTGAEPDGLDDDLICALDEASRQARDSLEAARPAPETTGTVGTLAYQVLERPLKPGEVSLDELEAAFRAAEGPDETAPLPVAQPAAAAPAGPVAPRVDRPLEDAIESRIAAQTIRVNVGTLEHLMTMVSELVLTRNQLLEIARRHDDSHFKSPLQRLSHITAELQDGAMKTRMQPIGNAWSKLPRVVRDLASELGKSIELVMEGAETELDRQVLEQIKDPLTHMVRNSADHGIEPAAERRLLGKPETGRIKLSAAHESGSITIRIADDGRGLDIARIRRKALELGLSSAGELERMTDAQVARFIFHPGFSTAAKVTNVSGRGVGMDVVKTNIDAIGGTIDIASEPGKGATISVKIPLTLAIVSALIVAVEEQRFAIPQVVVREMVRVRPGSEHAIESLNGASVLRLRGRLLPVVSLAGVMGLTDGEAQSGFVVVTQVGQQQFGILVDGVLHTEEIVVKPMSAKLKSLQLFSGNTILGDGAVVLILDPNGLARSIGKIDLDSDIVAAAETEHGGAIAERETILVFRAGGGSLRAVPLSLVTRLEEIDASTIEWTTGRPLVQYRGSLMPLIPAHVAYQIRRDGSQPLIIFSDGERTMGLAVEAIVDILDEHVEVAFADTEPGVLGSAVIGGRATQILDLAHYLPQAYPDWLSQTRGQKAVRNRDVILLEPSAFVRDMLVPVLKAAGFRPVPCASAGEAQEALSARRSIHAVVVDLETTESGSLALLQALKTDAKARAVVKVGLAAIPRAQIVEQALALGVSDVIAKFDRHALMAALSAQTDQTLAMEAA